MTFLFSKFDNHAQSLIAIKDGQLFSSYQLTWEKTSRLTTLAESAGSGG